MYTFRQTVLYLFLVCNVNPDVVILHLDYAYFPGQQLLNAFSKIVVKRIAAGQRITVEVDGLEEYQVHTYGPYACHQHFLR